MEQISHEHCRRADQVHGGVAVGLQFLQRHMAVKAVGCGGQQISTQFLPGEHGGAFLLQQGIGVVFPAVGHVQRHMAHLPLVAAEPVGPLAGQGKGLVDVIFFIGRGIGRQHKAVEYPKRQHQNKDQLVQRQFPAQRSPDPKEHHQTGQRADDQEEPAQKPADLAVGDQQRQGALHGLPVDGKAVVPEHRSVAVSDGQPAVAGVMGGQRHAVAPAFGALHRVIQPQGNILSGQYARHIAGGAGQNLPGSGIGKDQLQVAGGLAAPGAEHKPHHNQVVAGGKGLFRAAARLDEGVQAVFVAHPLREALVGVGAHHGQPDQQQRCQAGPCRTERNGQRTQFLLVCVGHSCPSGSK